MTAWYLRGLRVLLALLLGWLSGKYGKHGSVGARFGAAGFVAYGTASTAATFPIAPWVIGAAFLAAVVLAATGRIALPKSKPAKKAADKGKGKAPAKKPAPAAEETTTEVVNEAAPAPARTRLLARFTRRADTPAEDAEEDPEEGSPEAPEDAPEEAAADPSREAIAAALHHLYRGGSGVLHTALYKHLGLPDSQAVKRVLDGAGIPHRPGVRTPVGNGPGVHRDDFPAPPPPLAAPQGSGVAAGQPANANANNAANAPEEGLAVDGNDWTAEDLARGHRFVQDVDRGPSVWTIEYHPSRREKK
ncbi:hypothetical protein VSR01_17325 [Actinacidiphila sp. DG2A-62]|uniref:hypothetical protein n=1 Tax=Actinacidiphila sp. DG2A-62 TaxID=3108821 RepID=UPI002DB7598A|nr:hypothetical protein [Actinacidiphila sp. DG2A-62]MEC3995200.1 hypothetical protein [Actinacidiphila sp. DG2A-62]